MEEHDVIAASESLVRAYKLFLLLIKWILSVFGLSESDSSKLPILSIKSLKSAQDEYVDKHRAKFLTIFSDDKSRIDWNANIDSIIFDKDALRETLQDPENEIEKKWKRSILIEATPRGNVIMFYDVFKQGFSYYCDQTVMPYDIINAVAMKYVMTFRCHHFFVDSGVLPKQQEDDAVPVRSSRPIAKEPQPFAKFKSYNTVAKKSAVVEKTINRFLHLGGVRNWQPITVTKKLNPLNGFKTDLVPSNQKLSYAEYKKAQQLASAASK